MSLPSERTVLSVFLRFSSITLVARTLDDDDDVEVSDFLSPATCTAVFDVVSF